jgi:hypothetical protein
MSLALKVGLIGVVVLLLLIALGTATMDSIANSDGVHAVPLPAGSLIAGESEKADYTDAYEIPIESDLFGNIDGVAKVAFQKGKLEGKTDNEVMYSGHVPGLRFYVSYVLTQKESGALVTVSTAVYYTNWGGKLYFNIVRPIHRRIVPAALARMMNNARI